VVPSKRRAPFARGEEESMGLLRILIVAVVLGAWLSPTSARAQDATLVEAASAVYAAQAEAFAAGMATPEDVYTWSVRWLAAVKGQQPDAALADHLARMEALAARAEEQVAAGMIAPAVQAACRYYVLEARAWKAKTE